MLWTEEMFGVKKPIIAMLHLDALPGDPLFKSGDDMDMVVEHARADLHALQDGGVDGIIVSNEFSLPYLNELSEEFGGIVVHSCGNIAHQLNNLANIHNLRGINFGVSETRFEVMWERFGGKVVLLPHCSSTAICANFSTAYEWVEHVLKVKTHNRGLALMVAPQVRDFHASEMQTAMREKTGLFDDLGQILMFGGRMRKMLREAY
jgi:hypothetical protein